MAAREPSGCPLHSSCAGIDIIRFYEPIFATPISDVNVLRAYDYSIFGECFDYEITSAKPLVLIQTNASPDSTTLNREVTLGTPSRPVTRVYPWIATHCTLNGLPGIDYVYIFFTQAGDIALLKVKSIGFMIHFAKCRLTDEISPQMMTMKQAKRAQLYERFQSAAFQH